MKTLFALLILCSACGKLDGAVVLPEASPSPSASPNPSIDRYPFSDPPTDSECTPVNSSTWDCANLTTKCTVKLVGSLYNYTCGIPDGTL